MSSPPPEGGHFNLNKNEILRAADCWELKTPGMSRFPRRQITHTQRHCGNELSPCSLRSHLATQHDVHTAPALSPDLRDEERPPRTYKADHPFEDGFFWCPVAKCEGRSSTKFWIRRHFVYCHPQDYVDEPGEDRYAKCGRYGMQVNPSFLGHQSSKNCVLMWQV